MTRRFSEWPDLLDVICFAISSVAENEERHDRQRPHKSRRLIDIDMLPQLPNLASRLACSNGGGNAFHRGHIIPAELPLAAPWLWRSNSFATLSQKSAKKPHQGRERP
jgi:hypothetical protein